MNQTGQMSNRSNSSNMSNMEKEQGQTSRHFTREHDDLGIVWLHFNMADASANVLSTEVLEELEQELIHISQSQPKGLVILSDKSSGFIAGANVKAFATIQEPEQAEEFIKQAHGILFRLEALAFPTVTLIHGYCLGGGLELALACDYRIARNDESTRLGFPEVRLGIFPGFGGSVRSIKTIGHVPAMSMMLSGRSVSGRTAQRMGLVDLAVPDRQLRNAAIKTIQEQPARHRPGLLHQLAGFTLLRPVLAAIFRRQVAKKAIREHFPAPYALINHWQRYAGHASAMYRSEAREVSRLLVGQTAQNLIRVFLLQEELKSMGDKKAFSPRHVHVVGGGVMGGDIAAWCALRGMSVTLQDREPKYLTQAMKRAHGLFKKKLKDGYSIQAAMDRLMPDHHGYGVPKADVVIEAIYEDAVAKQALYSDLEPRMKDDALLASNTSSIPLATLGEKLAQPNRLVGLHFFNPVAMMPLLEIVTDKDTDAEMIIKAKAFARHIDKLPLPVTSSPGFLVNRILMPYLLEAVKLFEEGESPESIDQAAKHFGMPMGPIELADTVGLDICLSVSEKLSELLHNEVPESLKAHVAEGRLGRKSNQGYYLWKKGRPVKDTIKGKSPAPEIADRLIFRLINEAVACLREGVVADTNQLDAGIIFGTGFAPFRGGPMHYVEQQGIKSMQQRMNQLATHQGEHFHPDQGWDTLFSHP